MEKLIKSVENVHPGKYDLRVSDIIAIHDSMSHDSMSHDIFRLIGFVFRLGFARGQKAAK